MAELDAFLEQRAAVRRWIEQTLQVRLQDDDLVEALKNGIVLCYIMLEVVPQSIPRIQEATTQQFKLKENLSFFAQAAEEYGVPKGTIVTHRDLWLAPDVVRLVRCIAAIATIAEERDFRVSFRECHPITKPSAADLPADERTAITNLLTNNRAGRGAGARPKVSEAILRKRLALLGDSADMVSMERGVVKLQALVRGHLARLRYAEISRHVAYRDKVAKEILATERSYVESLTTCVIVYMEPLKENMRESKPMLSGAQQKAIFSELPVLLNFNAELLRELEPLVEKWNAFQCIGPLFLKLVTFMKIYTSYISNYNHAVKELETSTRNNPKFAAFVANAMEDPRCNGLSLASFLIMPVQRIPRYSLLLQDMVKHTWASHPDYKDLQEAAIKLKECAKALNLKKEESENLERLAEIESALSSKLKVPLCEPHRRYIDDQEFGDKRVWLCNDLVLVGKADISTFQKFRKRSTDRPDKWKPRRLVWVRDVEMVQNGDGFIIRKEGVHSVVSAIHCSAADATKWCELFATQKESLHTTQQKRALAVQSKKLETTSKRPEEILRERRMEKQAKQMPRYDSVAQLLDSIDMVKQHLAQLDSEIMASPSRKRSSKRMEKMRGALTSDLATAERTLEEKKARRAATAVDAKTKTLAELKEGAREAQAAKDAQAQAAKEAQAREEQEQQAAKEQKEEAARAAAEREERGGKAAKRRSSREQRSSREKRDKEEDGGGPSSPKRVSSLSPGDPPKRSRSRSTPQAKHSPSDKRKHREKSRDRHKKEREKKKDRD
mmetsp:Transcript_4307/g.15157  ORF Transcript_4307/g.15157 Transcript_4307/m.15157 type:complete len:783 (+) Transcript_4307:172-2520(+)